MLNGLFNRSKQNPEQEQTEYIQYAQEVESTLRHLDSQLHANSYFLQRNRECSQQLPDSCLTFAGITVYGFRERRRHHGLT